MKSVRNFLLVLSALLALWAPQGHAEDIDIYSNAAVVSTDLPNVLFVIDTGANFSSSAAVPCTAYADTGLPPSLGDTAGGIEQCALVAAIASLEVNKVNIGVLVNNNNTFATDVRVPTYSTTADDTTAQNAAVPAAHETCQGTYGGCLVRKLARMNAVNKISLINFIKSWKTAGGNSNTEFNVKSGGDRTANMMQEAWAYYNGKTGMSTKTYSPSILDSGCQKNFIIFIGNAFNVSGTPSDTGAESPDNTTNGLKSSVVAATDAQKTKIEGTINFSPATCGVTSIASSSAASNWSENWADEWARFLKQKDGSADKQQDQNITTYTIGVVNDASCKADYPALLTSMASNGGGSYFKTSNVSEVSDAINKILNEIQAVESVFASASLPVSVNAQGTFLNQIFMGMFRPDGRGNPRWLGNLKQYQLIKNADGDLVLGDANGTAAIDSATDTGFIRPGAQSFWTGRNTSVEPDASGGYYQRAPIGNPPSGYDDPDGNLIEKGGAAQQLRIENMLANFAADPTVSASNPRRLYIACPASSGCTSTSLSHSSNAFSTQNTAIPKTTAFGTTSTLGISSITRSGATATVTTVGSHGLTTGDSVEIKNVTQTDYNGTKTPITVASPTSFTFTGLVESPPTTTTGAYIISSGGATNVNITSLRRDQTNALGDLNLATVSVDTDVAHGFTAGVSSISITGVTPGNYNVTNPTLLTASGTNFTFNTAVYPTTPSSNNYKAKITQSAIAVTVSKFATNVIRGDTGGASHNFHLGQTVTIANTGVGKYDGDHVLTEVTSTTFKASVSGLGSPGTSAPGSTVAPKNLDQTITQITRNATTNMATATATGLPANWFGNAVGATKTVSITRASTVTGQEGYLTSGTTITCVDATCTSFTYQVPVTPFATGSGAPTMLAGLIGAVSHTIAAGDITRSGTTATIANLPASTFVSGSTYNIAVSGTEFPNESAYTGSKIISCVGTCTSATFGPVSVTPTSPATGSGMQVVVPVAPDGDTLIKWVRGEDNFGDELGPDVAGTALASRTKATVRPSIHGDVLHSRPVVVNYGSAGLVVYYGANDGVFRAVNGSKTASIGSSPAVPPGGELWGLILPEHTVNLNRQRLNSPEVKLTDTLLSTALPKDYFVDGPTGAFQQLDSSGNIATAYLYLTMRRGGRFIYALNVTNPTNPLFMWKKSSNDTGFGELGQTWSRPRVTVVNGVTDPVLVMAGGYDPAEDKELPEANSMGRGIFVMNAATGALVWKAVYGSTAACGLDADGVPTCTVPTLTHAIPSDIAFRDRDSDGKTDRMYFGDMGGNVWRVDMVTSTDGSPGTATSTPGSWRITKIASLGCDNGAAPPCSTGKAPRKFFFPPTVISVGATGTTGSFDAVLIGSGDREHPLTSSAAGSAHMVNNRFYMIKDTVTSATPQISSVSGLQASIDGVTVQNETTLFPAFKSKAIASMVRVSSLMTVTTTTPHTFVVGDTVVIDGAARTFLDGQFKILSVTSNTFTYTSTSDTDLSVGAGGNATVAVPFTSSSVPNNGFYTYLAMGEKVVNAPITVSGTTFFGTNRPEASESNTCGSNLGQARGYGLDPFTGATTSTVYDGGGLPPSPVAGVIEITDPNTGVVSLERFCIGCGSGGGSPTDPPCDSALQECATPKPVPKKPTRTYWYRK